MQLTVSGFLNQFQRIMQGVLFPNLHEQLGPLTVALAADQILRLIT